MALQSKFLNQGLPLVLLTVGGWFALSQFVKNRIDAQACSLSHHNVHNNSGQIVELLYLCRRRNAPMLMTELLSKSRGPRNSIYKRKQNGYENIM